jgi:hypothetical protein
LVTVPAKISYRPVSTSLPLEEPEPTRLLAGFFVYRARDYAQREMISRGSFQDPAENESRF